MTDTFKLGGHEFTSRFILGSGKYSLDLIKAAVEHAGAQIVTLALRRATLGSIDNILVSPCCPTPPVHAMRKKLSASHVLPVRLAAAISSKLNASMSPNICCRTIMRPSRPQKFSRKKALWFCRTCIRT